MEGREHIRFVTMRMNKMVDKITRYLVLKDGEGNEARLIWESDFIPIKVYLEELTEKVILERTKISEFTTDYDKGDNDG